MQDDFSRLAQLLQEIDQLCVERNWERVCTPKNLAINLHVEAGELAEHFTWLTDEQSWNLNPQQKQDVADELGDVLINVVHLSDKLGIDVIASAAQKIEKIKVKYPVGTSKYSLKYIA